MFKSRKKLLKIIEEQDRIIKNLDKYRPELENAFRELKCYRDVMKTITANESNYLHTYFNTLINLVTKDRLEIVNNLKKEIEKSQEIYNSVINNEVQS